MEFDEMAGRETEWTEEQWREAEERYIKEHYPELCKFEKDRCTPQQAGTLDEYLMLLINGFINVSLRDGLDKHLMELLEDEWFHQWPLVHWAYASRLLYKAKSERANKRAVELLYPMAEAGCPGALYDIGYCYMNAKGLEKSYRKAMYYWLLASELGYLEAQDKIKQEGYGSEYKNLPEELQLLFLYQIINFILKDNNADEDTVVDKLDVKERERLKKLCNRVKKLEKIVSKNKLLRDTGSLFWSDEENPYKVEI